uniref:ARAD1B08866p n=1 Tax=Blastobotrys adeninivorans TaxID=409370 RepID=A0A060T5P5_BLAAD
MDLGVETTVAEVNASMDVNIENTKSSKRRRRAVLTSDHTVMVAQACRHIAEAVIEAHAEFYNHGDSVPSPDKLGSSNRRGSIIGFKEVAAKAGLSPWHFHRVFRSITGVTPKAYGEACWDVVSRKTKTSTSCTSVPSTAPPQPPISNLNDLSDEAAKSVNLLSSTDSTNFTTANDYVYVSSAGQPTFSAVVDSNVNFNGVHLTGTSPVIQNFSEAQDLNALCSPPGAESVNWKFIDESRRIPQQLSPTLTESYSMAGTPSSQMMDSALLGPYGSRPFMHLPVTPPLPAMPSAPSYNSSNHNLNPEFLDTNVDSQHWTDFFDDTRPPPNN